MTCAQAIQEIRPLEAAQVQVLLNQLLQASALCAALQASAILLKRLSYSIAITTAAAAVMRAGPELPHTAALLAADRYQEPLSDILDLKPPPYPPPVAPSHCQTFYSSLNNCQAPVRTPGPCNNWQHL